MHNFSHSLSSKSKYHIVNRIYKIALSFAKIIVCILVKTSAFSLDIFVIL